MINQREDVEITELELRKERATKELEKVRGPQEHPLVIEKKAKVEEAELDIREYEARKKLQALRGEELKRAQVEEQVRLEKELERRRIEEQQNRAEAHQKWVEEWQEWALTQGVSRISIPADIKFRIKDAVAKALMDRSEQENRSDIEELVKITIQSILQPFLDKVKAEKKSRLIETWAFPQIEAYIGAQGLGGYLSEESRGKIREDVKNHFIKVLTGNEAVIWPNEIFDLLDTSLKSIKEKAREAREEKIKKERERVEGGEKAFWEKVKEKNIQNNIQELMEIGMNRFNWYLTIHRKELEPLKYEAREKARRYLEGELREGIGGAETDEEVRKIVDQILSDFFFEE